MPLPLARALLVASAAVVTAACAANPHVHPRAAEEIRRGYGYLGEDDVERADVAFAHALAFDGHIPEALNGAAVVARRRGSSKEARRLLDRALVARPEFAEALVNLGELDVAEGHIATAEARFRRALAIDPDLIPARLNLARTLLHQGRAATGADRERRWSAARREYLHLLESSPDVADAHHDLGYIDHEAGRFERAATAYARAAELEPRYADAHLGACVSLGRLGRLHEAADACRRCVAAAPSDERCASTLRALLAAGASPPSAPASASSAGVSSPRAAGAPSRKRSPPEKAPRASP